MKWMGVWLVRKNARISEIPWSAATSDIIARGGRAFATVESPKAARQVRARHACRPAVACKTVPPMARSTSSGVDALLSLHPSGSSTDGDGMLRIGGCRADELAA